MWKIVLILVTLNSPPLPMFGKAEFATEKACQVEMQASVKRMVKRGKEEAGQVRGEDYALKATCVDMSKVVKPPAEDKPKDKGDI